MERNVDHDATLVREKATFNSEQLHTPGPDVVLNKTAHDIPSPESIGREIKEEESEAAPTLEIIPSFTKDTDLTGRISSQAVTPDLQVNGKHLSAPSTPPLVDGRQSDIEMIEVPDFGLAL